MEEIVVSEHAHLVQEIIAIVSMEPAPVKVVGLGMIVKLLNVKMIALVMVFVIKEHAFAIQDGQDLIVLLRSAQDFQVKATALEMEFVI